ncbi:type VII toxin-antitoxin system HepT family RNase toxin [Parendozoicomonas haliclonae]|uniref:DUF86 domain-containing protein n=1 Tax=Parendozoicomonas haliclonae TaxID=1960125 RepID=A0A1X7AMV7_9GAMM|nr:DUF86 domain-containing protein [Parendozoicomonas haliclonae]SMA49373.1 hypothetical protein EHSB41UT_03217 [Parendozoicomonas haliclonae]
MDDVLLNKMAIIERCLARVDEEYCGHEEELMTNFTRQDAIILNIQRACQACIDMGNRTLALLKSQTVQESREVFDVLAEKKIISAELAHRMKMMVGFRNIAVHEYQRLDINIMKAVIEEHLGDLRFFGKTLLASQLD